MTLTTESPLRDIQALSTSSIPVDQTTFREAMGAVCTPVCIVAALDGPRPHGTTVSAFASLSLDPPMILVALASTSDLLSIISADGSFGVNVLGHEQGDLAMRFARKGKDKFDGVAWEQDHGAPRIAGAAGWLACEVAQVLPVGDHVIVCGAVVAAQSVPLRPLTYHARTFGTHSPAPTH